MIERSRVRLPTGALPRKLGQLSLPSLWGTCRYKWSTSILVGVKAGRAFTYVWWQVTLCNPTWQVTAHSWKTCSRRGLYSASNTVYNAIPQLIIAGCQPKYSPKIFMQICLTVQTFALAMGLEHVGLCMHECTCKKEHC